jgi:hypothetical protein
MFKNGMNFNILTWELSCGVKSSLNQELIAIKRISGKK